MLRQTAKSGLVLLGFLFVFLPKSISARVIDQVVAVIDGEPYTLSNFSEYAATKMSRQFPSGDLNKINGDDREVLEQFITNKLLEAEIKQAGVRVSDQEIDRYVQQIKEKNRLTDAELETALKREGATLASYRESVRSELEKNEIINLQVRKKVNITAEDVERYYKANTKNYKTEQRVRLRHILFPLAQDAPPEQLQESMRVARDVYKRIAAGEDFAQLAREFSQGAGASEGGDIGWVVRGTLLQGIEEIAFQKLSVGEVSQPFRTSMGVHLAKLEARDDGSPLPLSVVSARIKEELYEKSLEERFQRWLKTDLRRKHRVDVKLPGVVFRPEDTKEGTVDSLMASASRANRRNERSFLSYLNPFSYIFQETPIEGEEAPGQLSGKNIVSLFGVPLFTTDTVDDVPGDPLAPIEGAGGLAPVPAEPAAPQNSGESRGFFSSVLDTLNPFSSNP